MKPIKAVLQQALPRARVTERRDKIEVHLPGGPRVTFRVISAPDELPVPYPSVLFLERADPRTLAMFRVQEASFVTATGQVYLVTPGMYVDIRPARALGDPDRTRNPFSTRGRMVCVSMLLFPERRWTIRELARCSAASESFVSRVVSGLDDQGFIETEAGGLRPHAEFLFAALAEHWPRPTFFFVGRAPREGEAVIGGGPAYENLGLALPALPRAYVATRTQLRLLVVQTKSTPATSRMGEWEAVVQPLPLQNVFVPALVCALELARDPRGREVLNSRSLVPWPIHV
ncbi:MAG: hypothetical protein HY775_06525 [Acidobacteria bacterium]|nr:hypothetical protein [Acidobacteriota bacterium]